MKTKEQIKDKISEYKETIKQIKSMKDVYPERKKEAINRINEKIEVLTWTINKQIHIGK